MTAARGDGPFKVYSSQFSYRYGRQIHFPYSIASLAAYVSDHPDLRDRYRFERCVVFRDDWQRQADACADADVLLCSCYVWNWEITNAFARQVRARRPTCLIVFGGPQVPDRAAGFFERHPYVDVLVHKEGERVLASLLRRYAAREPLDGVRGATVRPRVGDGRAASLPVVAGDAGALTFVPEPRISALQTLPSPYLTGVIWQLVERSEEVDWIAPWETTRGCPYQCTFCDWGSETYTKVRRVPDERLHGEIEWFARERIVYVDCCDSNFGILPQRDLELAQRLSAAARAHGYPTAFRQSWAKNTSDKIIPIAQALRDGGLLTAVGLAVESLDPHALQAVKRRNIAFESFSELSRTFRDIGLPTYTEVIRGLPGETLESFARGLELLLRDTVIGAIYVYHCTVLPNAELAEPAYRAEHRIETVRSPIQLAHSSIHDRGLHEYEDIVVGTNSFDRQDLERMYEYSWCALCLANLGVMEYVLAFYRRTLDVPFLRLFDCVLELAGSGEGAFAREVAALRAYLRAGYDGRGWDHYDPALGEIFWPFESASWLRLTWDNAAFQRELRTLAGALDARLGAGTEAAVLDDLCAFQAFVLSDRAQAGPERQARFEHDWRAFFEGASAMPARAPVRLGYALRVDPALAGFEWSKHAIWWGRRRLSFKAPLSAIRRVSL